MNPCWMSGLLCLASMLSGQTPPVEILADPPVVRLDGPQARFTLLVSGKTADGRLRDLTHDVRYRARDEKIATVRPGGLIQAVRDGTTQIDIDWQGQTRSVTVEIVGAGRPREPHFDNDVIPVLSRFNCNA